MENNLPAENKGFMDNIREKIKNSFVELVPDETWDAMVQQEIEAFFEKPVDFKVETKDVGWNQPTKTFYNFGDEKTKPTMFRTMVWGMCIDETNKHLKSEYVNNLVNIALEGERDAATGATKDIITEAIPKMVQQYFENIARTMTNQLAMDISAIANNNHNIRY
jgi:hypothetical protein